MQSVNPPARGAGVLEPLLVSVGLVLAVSLRHLVPIWQVGAGLGALGLLTGGAYLAGHAAQRMSRRGGPARAALITLVVSQPVVLVLGLSDLPVSRATLVGELVLLFVALAVTGTRTPGRARLAVAGGFAGLTALPTVMGLMAGPASEGPRREYVFSSYHDLSVVTHDVLPHEIQDGGGLTLLPDGRVLLVAGSGDALLLDLSEGLRAAPLELGLPMEVAAYRAEGHLQPEFYRVFDALYDEGRLFVSYIHWDRDRDCYALRLAEADFDGSDVGRWTTRFESKPCSHLAYAFNTSGGRIARLDPSHLLLAVGTLGMDRHGPEGWREASDYGRLHVLDRETWQSEVLTFGHRNPEGLLVAGDRIWSTEHGPHGGDELNLIEPGGDYGWPLVSYGTDYGIKTLASGRVPGDHSGFTPPVHSWTPSIGVSSLIEVAPGLFPGWEGDLLVGSLTGLGNGRSLFRVRLLDGRAVNVEKIPTESRVRDLLQLPGGPLVLWDGGGRVRLIRPADHVFSQCSGCHGVRRAQHGIGPDLYGVVGSPVARHADYGYSAALRGHGGRWSPARLDRFLEDPQREVPGTSMDHEGIGNAADRAEVIRFLSDVSAGRPVE